MHPGPGRERTSCLLSHIHIRSQTFFIWSEALRPSSVQVCRALALVGSFPPTPGFGQLGSFTWWFPGHCAFKLLHPRPPPHSASFPDSLSFPTALAVSRRPTSPTSLSAREAPRGELQVPRGPRGRLRVAAVADGACSHLGLVRRPPNRLRPPEAPARTRAARRPVCAALSAVGLRLPPRPAPPPARVEGRGPGAVWGL